MPNDANRAISEARAAVLDTLLEKVRQDRFPSLTVLDQVEELLEPDDVPDYVQVLVEKISDDRFPSITLVRRVVSLTAP